MLREIKNNEEPVLADMISDVTGWLIWGCRHTSEPVALEDVPHSICRTNWCLDAGEEAVVEAGDDLECKESR